MNFNHKLSFNNISLTKVNSFDELDYYHKDVIHCSFYNKFFYYVFRLNGLRTNLNNKTYNFTDVYYSFKGNVIFNNIPKT